MKKVKLIYNPNSGKMDFLLKFDVIFNIYQKYGFSVSVYRINENSNVEDGFDDIDDSWDHILIAGGDGTIHNVVNAMMNRGINLPIAVIPVGTANDFAGIFNMPSDLDRCLEQILNSEIKKIDLGKVNDKYFINILSMGVFTDISQKIDKTLKKSFGKLAYYISGIKEISNIKSLDIDVISRHKENKEDKYLMFVFNGKTAGKIPFAYKAQIDDGLFDVIILKATGITKSINIFFKILNGTYLEDEEVVDYFKTDKLVIESDEEIVVDLDGEKGPKFPLEISCIKGGLKILGCIE